MKAQVTIVIQTAAGNVMSRYLEPAEFARAADTLRVSEELAMAFREIVESHLRTGGDCKMVIGIRRPPTSPVVPG